MIKDRVKDLCTRVCDKCGDEKYNTSYWNLKYKDIHLCYNCTENQHNIGRPAWNKGKRSVPKVGTKHIDTSGYVRFYIGRNVVPGGYVLEHRKIMEEELGRPLEKGELIHHIDCNKVNNDINNLFLCESMSHHKHLHNRLEKVAVKLIGKGIIGFKNGKYFIRENLSD